MKGFRVQNRKEVLIINCDDLGMNPRIDQGIIELLNAQKVKSASLVINGRNIAAVAQWARDLLRENPQLYFALSLGLHFNLTEGAPLNPRLKGGPLAPQGLFLGKTAFYQQIQTVSPKEVRQVAQELRLQIYQFIRLFGRRPSHLDGHNHVHLVPELACVVAEVMAEMGIYRRRALNELLPSISIPLNNKFLRNNELSQTVYAQKQILSPRSFVGLQLFGKFEAGLLKGAAEQQEGIYRSAELMCHPGYSDPLGNEWESSLIHSVQLELLSSPNFDSLRTFPGISSYFDLKEEGSCSEPRVLIYSKLNQGTGNYTTALRMKGIFEELGFKVYLWNADDNLEVICQSSDLLQFLLGFGISLIVGVNVSRSATIIEQATLVLKVPYFLVVAGTDANITFQDEAKVAKVARALKNCQCLISLSESMSEITRRVLQKVGIEKEVVTIPQSNCLPSEQEQGWSKPARQFILFPTSFREVKCVHHVLPQLNQLIKKHSIDVLLAGPILDQPYYEKCVPLLGQVKYLGVVPQSSYVLYLRDCLALINTSQSEGMSCSILEALQRGIPVIVRKNAGNLELVSHMVTGLVYEEPEEFLSLCELLMEDRQLRQSLTNNSRQVFLHKYDRQHESSLYRQVIEKYYSSWLYIETFGSEKVRVLQRPGVHPASPVNVQLFRQAVHSFAPGNALLDLGCGTGLFGLVLLSCNQGQQVNLWLSDIDFGITALALYNCRQSSVWHRLNSVQCLESDLFTKVPPSVSFRVVAFNPPQSPFRRASSCLDKNGGPDATRFFGPVFDYLRSHPSTILFQLYSFLAWPARYRQLLSHSGLAVTWESTREVHFIESTKYDSLQEGLSEYILEHWSRGRAEIEFSEGQFRVPAVVYRIEGPESQN